MSYVSLRAAIKGLLADWIDAPVAHDNALTPQEVNAAQANGTPWVALTILPGDSITAGIGDGPCVRNTGLISLQIFTADGVGEIPAYTLCDSLADALQHKQVGHLETLALSVSRAGHMNGYFQLNASIPYRYK